MIRNKKMLLKIVCSLLSLFFLIGCAISYPVLKQEPVVPDAGTDYATIVAGLRFKEGNLTSLLMALYVAGEMMPLKGIVRKDYKSDTVPAITPLSVWSSATYLKADDNGHAYRTWKISRNMLDSKSNNCIFFPALIRSEEGIIGGYDAWGSLNGMPAPFTWKKAVTEEMIMKPSDNWEFFGNHFSIDKPGIYYLGEYEIKANLDLLKEDNELVLRWVEESSGNSEDVYSFLSANDLEGEFHDLSGSWTKIKGQYFRDFAGGKK